MADQTKLRNEIAAAFLDKPSAVAKEGIQPGEFLSFYDVYFPRIYNYIRFRCVDASLTDDLTSIVFEKALCKCGDFDPERGPFGAWLFAIARNTVNTQLRIWNRRICLALDEISEHQALEPLPEESVIQSETKNELLAALSRLDGRERDLISLKFAGHLTNRRIAEITSLTESNVGIILYRAIQKLRTVLKNKK